jgi:Raf kinase inhibitor-like YbhB/YbcL family protein
MEPAGIQLSTSALEAGPSMISRQGHKLRRMAALLAIIIPPLAVTWRAECQAGKQRGTSTMFQLTSKAFAKDGNIPVRFSCKGEDISPELSWSGAPAGTKSFALIMHDPDAPVSGGYTHWIVYNMPATVTRIPEKAPSQDRLPAGGMQGKNDSGKYGYMGPCPPSGTHRYYFRLYALDTELDSSAAASKTSLEKAVAGHVLAEAELMGRFTRASKEAA